MLPFEVCLQLLTLLSCIAMSFFPAFSAALVFYRRYWSVRFNEIPFFAKKSETLLLIFICLVIQSEANLLANTLQMTCYSLISLPQITHYHSFRSKHDQNAEQVLQNAPHTEVVPMRQKSRQRQATCIKTPNSNRIPPENNAMSRPRSRCFDICFSSRFNNY